MENSRKKFSLMENWDFKLFFVTWYYFFFLIEKVYLFYLNIFVYLQYEQSKAILYIKERIMRKCFFIY